uniref:Uncharacterized protein n=1 Tax=Dulem virus 166 TaxID=3145643 RepID=A0AAU8AVP1_9VIRU
MEMTKERRERLLNECFAELDEKLAESEKKLKALVNPRGRFIIQVRESNGLREREYRSTSRNMRWHFNLNNCPDLLLCFDGKGKLLTVFKKFDDINAGEYMSPELYREYERSVFDE